MMKRLLTILLSVLFVNTSLAQNLTISFDGNVEEMTTDLDARALFPKKDINDNLCALIKVTLTNALKNPLVLETGALGVTERVEQESGEVWFYVPAGVKNLSFKCAEYAPLDPIPVKLKEGTVFRITLNPDAMFETVSNAVLSSNFLKIKLNETNATISIGRTKNYELLSNQNISGDFFSQLLDYGEYYIKIEHPLRETHLGKVRVDGSSDKLDINLAPAFGYLSVESSPSGADIFMDGKSLGKTPCHLVERFAKGNVELSLQYPDYHPHSFTVEIYGDGSRQTTHQTLKPRFANITLTCPDKEAEIWVDNEFKAKGAWTGRLSSISRHFVESRRTGHRSQSINIDVVDGQDRSYTLPEPIALYGTLTLTTTPAECSVTIDGNPAGETPLIKRLLEGKHTVKLAKEGYKTRTITATIEHNKTLTLNETLEVAKKRVENRIYKVGDYYNEGGKEGVVFEVSDDGRHGKIVSLEIPEEMLKWAPAKEWCEARGNGWYLPTKDELVTLYKAKDAVNKTLKTNGYQLLQENWHWSSTEDSSDRVWYVTMDDGYTFNRGKYYYGYVRAVSAFGTQNTAQKSVNREGGVSKNYKVGDYYNEGGKEGVVFEVFADGRHGKIVSLEGAHLNWNDANEWCKAKGNGWYLPTKDELLALYEAKDAVNKTLKTNGYPLLQVYWHWSSTEYSSDSAWDVYMDVGDTSLDTKNYYNYVRAVSAFGTQNTAQKSVKSSGTNSAQISVNHYSIDGVGDYAEVQNVWGDSTQPALGMSTKTSSNTFRRWCFDSNTHNSNSQIFSEALIASDSYSASLGVNLGVFLGEQPGGHLGIHASTYYGDELSFAVGPLVRLLSEDNFEIHAFGGIGYDIDSERGCWDAGLRCAFNTSKTWGCPSVSLGAKQIGGEVGIMFGLSIDIVAAITGCALLIAMSGY